MHRQVTHSEVSRRFGELTSATSIDWERVNLDGLLRVLARLNRTEIGQFKAHLDAFERDGCASAYLLGILAMSSGKRRGTTRRATVMPLQSNVVGVAFG